MIKIFNNYCATLLIGGFVILATSCQPLFFPNTLAPAKPYSVGKGEVGIRSFNFAPLGADFKVGITNNIQVSGIHLRFILTKKLIFIIIMRVVSRLTHTRLKRKGILTYSVLVGECS